jgi:small subunit ribosomal protein S21
MIVIKVDNRDTGGIDRALKKLKTKFESTGVAQELRSRQSYTKKSVKRREECLKSKYYQSKVITD